MATTFTNLLYHLVFSTKERVPSIHEDLCDPLYGYMGGIIRDRGGILLEAGGMPDHIHLLAKFKPTALPSANPRWRDSENTSRVKRNITNGSPSKMSSSPCCGDMEFRTMRDSFWDEDERSVGSGRP